MRIWPLEGEEARGAGCFTSTLRRVLRETRRLTRMPVLSDRVFDDTVVWYALPSGIPSYVSTRNGVS
jgi:hypothetical protein